MSTRPPIAYRLLLRVLSRRFRADHQSDIEQLVGQTRAERGRPSLLRLWTAAHLGCARSRACHVSAEPARHPSGRRTRGAHASCWTWAMARCPPCGARVATTAAVHGGGGRHARDRDRHHHRDVQRRPAACCSGRCRIRTPNSSPTCGSILASAINHCRPSLRATTGIIRPVAARSRSLRPPPADT